MPTRTIVLSVLCLMVAGARAHAAPTTAPIAPAIPIELLAHGTDANYWIAQVQTSETDPQSMRTIMQVRSHASKHWRTLGDIDGRAIELANRGSDLIVLLDNGQWMLRWPDGGTLGQPLPFGARMLGITADDHAVLWALGRGPIAPVSAPVMGPTTIPVTATTQSTTNPILTSGIAIFQWDTRAWQPRVMLHETDFLIGPDGRDVSMTTVASLPLIALRDAHSRVHVLRLEPTGALRDLGSVESRGAFKLIGSNQRAFLWLSASASAGSIVAIDDSLGPPVALQSPDDIASAQAVTLADANGQLRLIFAHDGKTFEQGFAASGHKTGQPITLSLTQAINIDSILEWIGLVVLFVITLFVFAPARRRALGAQIGVAPDRAFEDDSEINSPAASRPRPVHRVAPLLPRMQAAVFDALPILIAAFVVVNRVQSAPDEDRMTLLSPASTVNLVAMGIYFAHTLIGELWAGRTIGKKIFGLRVVSMHGTPAGALAIIVRNVIRVLEVTLPLSVLVLFFNAFHQRLGDMAANTVVVSDEEESTAKQDE